MNNTTLKAILASMLLAALPLQASLAGNEDDKLNAAECKKEATEQGITDKKDINEFVKECMAEKKPAESSEKGGSN
jgi:entry exclusion lipoprotein TrbK